MRFDLYERTRPAHSALVLDAVAAYARAGRPCDDGPLRVVEIGPGTGQATAGLLQRGFLVTAVEIGPRLAARLRQKFADRLDVVTGDFDVVEVGGPGRYDLVLAAASFGHLDPATRVPRIAALLRPGGALAVVDHEQVADPVDRGFFDRAFPIYRDHRGDSTPASFPTRPVEAERRRREIERFGAFGTVTLRHHRDDRRYSAEQYCELVRSYWLSQQMDKVALDAMLADIASLVEREFDGYVIRPVLVSTVMARRLAR